MCHSVLKPPIVVERNLGFVHWRAPHVNCCFLAHSEDEGFYVVQLDFLVLNTESLSFPYTQPSREMY